MAILHHDDKERIMHAIRAAEERTSAEIVAVIANRSDVYHFHPLRFTVFLTLTIPILAWSLRLSSDPLVLFMIQLVVFFFFSALMEHPRLQLLVVPRSVKLLKCQSMAELQFHRNGAHNTRWRTGVMIYVSQAEHYVEIVTDTGIQQMIDHTRWAPVVDAFTAHLKEGRVTEGFLTTIAATADVLAEKFPPAPRNPNELPNQVIELQVS